MYATTSVSTPKITVVRPTGSISAANAATFRAELNVAVESDSQAPLLVDMEQVEFLDSAGLMVLVNALSRTQKTNRKFGLCSVSAPIKMIFELTQLERVFEIYENSREFEAAIS